MRLICALAVVLFSFQSVYAIEIYVDNVQGDDRNSGRSPLLENADAGPVRTIAKALRISHKGDKVVLKNTGTPYRESIALQARRNSGYPGSPFVLEGNGAVIDGSVPIMNLDWKYIDNDIYEFCPHWKTFQQLFKDDVPLDRVKITQKEDLKNLKPLQWTLFEGNIYFRAEAGKGTGSYNLSHSGLTVGVTLYQVKYLKINNLIVQGFQLDGINAHDLALEVSLNGINARGNGRSGISIGGASRVELNQVLVGDNGTAQLRTEGFAKVQVKDSDLLENTAPAIVHEGGQLEIDGKAFVEE